MNHRISHTTLVALAILATALLTSPATAAEGPLAAVSLGADSLYFTPQVDYGTLVLTVSGGGQVLRQEFAAGEPVVLSLAGLPDDSYTWELRATPSRSELRAQLLTNRELGEAAPTGGSFKMSEAQTGYFTLQGGALLRPDVDEAPAAGAADSGLTPVTGAAGSGLDNISAATQVIAMDLIVQGSECVGVDCTSSESFGFDTLRLKENNLRIKFQDTSNSGSFPTRDWQITANDSSNGGAEKFSIDDIDGGRTPFTIEANAPSNSLYVDDGGRVGLGTATPVVDLQVVSGNTPTLRLEQNGSSGFTAQTWDVAGNEANFFVRDVTNGSKLSFRIRPGAPESSIDIAASGNVGIGTSSPQEKLHVLGGDARVSVNSASAIALDLNNSVREWSLRNAGNGNFNISDITGGGDQVRIAAGAPALSLVVAATGGTIAQVGIGTANPGFPLQVGTDGTNGNGAHVTVGGVWTDGSSRASKKGIRPLAEQDAMAALAALEPMRYTYIGDPTEEYVGFIAEDVPDLVAVNDRKHLAPMDIVGVLTRVVKTQQEELEQLRSETAAKDSALADLAARLERLEAAQR